MTSRLTTNKARYALWDCLGETGGHYEVCLPAQRANCEQRWFESSLCDDNFYKLRCNYSSTCQMQTVVYPIATLGAGNTRTLSFTWYRRTSSWESYGWIESGMKHWRRMLECVVCILWMAWKVTERYHRFSPGLVNGSTSLNSITRRLSINMREMGLPWTTCHCSLAADPNTQPKPLRDEKNASEPQHHKRYTNDAIKNWWLG